MATNDSLIQVTDLRKHYHMGAIKALDGVTDRKSTRLNSSHIH